MGRFVIVLVALGVSAGIAGADRIAPAIEPDPDAKAAPEPEPDGEPRLITTGGDPDAPMPEARASHKGQFGLAVQLVSGGRFIKTYDDEHCGDRDSNNSDSPNSAYCLGRVPFSFDLVASYGLTARIELLFELRLGLERDFGGQTGSSDGPRLRHYAPGVKFYFDDRGLVKFFSTAQIAIDSTGYEDPMGNELDTDFTLRNANGLLLDFHDAYGAYAFFAEEIAFRRWISVGVELGIGFQGRYP